MQELSGKEIAQWTIFVLVMLGLFLVGHFWNAISSVWRHITHETPAALPASHDAHKSNSTEATGTR